MADPHGRCPRQESPLYVAALVTSTAAALALDTVCHDFASRLLWTLGGLLWTFCVRMLVLWFLWKGFQSLVKLWGLLSFRAEPSRVEAPPVGFNLADVSAATRAFVELHHPELFAAMDYGSLTLLTPNASAHPLNASPSEDSHSSSGEGSVLGSGETAQQSQEQPQPSQKKQQVLQTRQRQLPDEIWILGTAHVSRTSALHVKQAILHLRPQAVAVELCGARKMLLFQPDPDDVEPPSDQGSMPAPQGPGSSSSHASPQEHESAADYQADYATNHSDTRNNGSSHAADQSDPTSSVTANNLGSSIPQPPTGTQTTDQSLQSSPSIDADKVGDAPSQLADSLPSHPLDFTATSTPASERTSQESSPLYNRPVLELPAAIPVPIPPPVPVPAQPNLIQVVMKARAEGQNIMTALLGALMAQAAAQLKTTLGLEFIRAHQAILQLNNEAGGTHPTQLILADVAVDVTLRRCWGVLTRFQKLRVCWYILTGLVFGKIGAEDLEELMKEDVMEGAMKEISARFPTLLGPLLHERNHHMANVLECMAMTGLRQRVVLVCGKAHVAGIVHCLLQSEANRFATSRTPPS